MFLPIKKVFRTSLLSQILKMPEVSATDLSLLNNSLKESEALVAYLKEEVSNTFV